MTLYQDPTNFVTLFFIVSTMVGSTFVVCVFELHVQQIGTILLTFVFPFAWPLIRSEVL